MTTAEIQKFADALPKLRVLVVGDLMLDRYLWGNVSRISPEAPVPIVDIEKSESRPGGAANVALNVSKLGAQVSLCGIIGEDDNGVLLIDRLQQRGFDHSLVFKNAARVTTTKTRIIGNNQQILRVDQELRDELGTELSEEILSKLLPRLNEFDAIIFEDYDKGFLNSTLIAGLIKAANAANIPTVVDPKFGNFMAYEGVTLFKPNLKELNEALNLRIKNGDITGIQSAVATLRQQMPHAQTLVTLSENGVLTVDENGKGHHIEAHFRKIADVSGAGDTVIAVMALAIAANESLQRAAAISNLAGGLVCEEVGVVPIDLERLLTEMEAV